MAKSPYLPLYYNDLRGSTQDWTDEEFGAYVRLLIYQWDKGSIPSQMSRLVKIADSAEKNWPVLSQKFTPGEKGFLSNSVMERIRIEREKFSEHQKENVLKRWNKDTKPIPNKYQKDTKKIPLEHELEHEEEIENEDFEKSEKLLMPFTSENFQVLWQNWKQYRKKEFHKTYKSLQSEQAALSHLVKLSKGDEYQAGEIISQSIANQWLGLFEFKKLKNGSRTQKQSAGLDNIKQMARDELESYRAKNA